jgi:hypothetical protein
VFDAGETSGVLYIAMRFIEGADLGTKLEHGPLPTPEAVRVVEHVAAALDAAHAAGLVHRDVKPGNILVSGQHVYLSDFGITKQMHSTTATGVLMGTMAYMAPEQLEGKPVDARTDVYALACVLFECLTGKLPFERETEVAMITAHLHEPPPRPSVAAPAVPGAMDEVVAKGMAKRPEDRYPSCGELAAAARAAVTGAPHAPPPARRARPRRRFVFAGAGVLLAAAAVGAFVFARGRAPACFKPVSTPAAAREPMSGPFVSYQLDACEPFNARALFVAAKKGAVPIDASARLGRGRDEWVRVAPDGHLLVSTTRFGCDDWACTAVVPPGLAGGGPVVVEGKELHADADSALAVGGQVVVYTSEDGAHGADLWITRKAGREWSAPALLTGDSPFRFNASASFSADGSRISFNCGPTRYPDPGTGICEVHPDGTGLREVVGARTGPGAGKDAFAFGPVYAPDGSLVFTANWQDLGTQIWRLPAGGGQAERLTHKGARAMCVLADGRIVAFAEGRRGSTVSQEIAVLSPDGETVFFLVTNVPVQEDVSCAG